MSTKIKKRGLAFYIKIYFKIIAQDIKSKMSYRADFIISNLGMIIQHGASFITFWILFQNFPSVMGWEYEEMLFFYGFSLIAMTPMQCLFDNNWFLRHKVYSGDFIKYCFRPINVFFYYISEIFDLKGIGLFTAGTAILIYSWSKLELAFSVLTLGLLVINLVAASLFMIAIMNLAAATCFWTINGGITMVFAQQFQSYARYPITIFGKFLRFVFTFVIPMAFVSYYPSLTFLSPDEIPLLTWLCPLIGVAFFLLSYFVWMKGAKNYSGTGS
ncbi:MAG: ABC-2 family transporter protein [Oscillospiraceae bacterium]|nr:ABC-2 family transporter protein [Oscillospiraceae bacterium]